MHISPGEFTEHHSDTYKRLARLEAGLTKSQRYYISMADGLVNEAGRHELEVQPAEIGVYVGGSLVTAKPDRPVSGNCGGEARGGVRGDVVEFSRASRNRLMRVLAKTDRLNVPLFVTLTYNDDAPLSREKWKRDIDVLGKRFVRQFPDASFVWRVEYQIRKSGTVAGELVAHYHLLVWGVETHDMRRWVTVNWYEVVGSGSDDHLRAGTSVERIRKWKGVMWYASKYIAKADGSTKQVQGRNWGVVNRSKMPWAVLVVMSVSNDVAVRVVRLARKMMGMGGKTLVWGVTFISDVERILDYIEIIEGFR